MGYGDVDGGDNEGGGCDNEGGRGGGWWER